MPAKDWRRRNHHPEVEWNALVSGHNAPASFATSRRGGRRRSVEQPRRIKRRMTCGWRKPRCVPPEERRRARAAAATLVKVMILTAVSALTAHLRDR
ncbi:hypothetical protein E2C01_088823 [Portunus trituberculatus]|uniref:Uncharacterized protein n=1 Tax=Portunus trituberculatus TaxID=210409 RepID=A0A5B7JH45_PORTR|nr:hypothetical protein [Portunus trituberculatus]